MRPFTSMSCAPLPSRGWNCVRAYVGTMNVLSRDSTAAGDSSCSNKFGSSSDVDRANSRFQRAEGGLELRFHSAADDVARQQLLRVPGGEQRDDRAVAVEQTRDVGDEVQ